MIKKAFFVAATGQNVGKTTICLGLVSGLLKRCKSVGFLKPVGQEHVETEEGSRVDKDVVLFKTHFQLKDPYEEMSPVLFPRGFTRDFLDGRVNHTDLTSKVFSSFTSIAKKNEITVIEGTGHMGVGSIVDLNNAQVAAQLKCPLILVAPGGLGSSFDELTLNRTQCEKHGVPLAGVILNRVLDEKREMILHYMSKALKRWDVPLLGAIPYDELLSTPTMDDFEQLFQTELLTGLELRLHHFHQIRLLASPSEASSILPRQLLIVPAFRDDIILAALTRYWDIKIAQPEEKFEIAILLTGKQPPKSSLIEQIRKTGMPMLYAPISNFNAFQMINTHTAKIRKDDIEKIEEAIRVVEDHIDFNLLQKRVLDLSHNF